MTSSNFNNRPDTDAICAQVQALLPEYNENALATRQAWEVEKHLTTCAACSEVSRQLQATVELLHARPHLDTSDDFMARLHAQLDTLEPNRSWKTTLQGWLVDAHQTLSVRRWPALGVGVALASVVGAAFVVTRPTVNPPVPPVMNSFAEQTQIAPITAQRNEQQHVALTASNPFDDPVAAHLEAQSSDNDNSTIAD